MTAIELYQAGKLSEAVQAVGAELRANPGDKKKRTFLFELLCFAGEFDRAEKQLDILGEESNDARMGALLYRAALHAERTRHELFRKREYPKPASDASEPPATPGTWNGQPFEHLVDADPRIGPRLEVFAAGQYLWLPFEHIASVEIQPPQRLRDLLWAPALIRPGPALGKDLGEVILPVLAPFSSQHPSDAVRLGRVTEWQEEDGEPAPRGQKMFLVDGEEVPLLELRRLTFLLEAATADHHASSQ